MASRCELGGAVLPHLLVYLLGQGATINYHECDLDCDGSMPYSSDGECTAMGRPVMQTKLTLRLDETLILKAKRYSNKSGKSVSQLVADYFTLIDAGFESGERELTPRVKSLLGALAGTRVTETDYRRHLEQKHR
jgi:hypothetical protein